MKVKDIMSKDPVCCPSSDIVMDVARVLRDKDIGSVPIVSSESGKIEGIVTDRDLCCGVLADGLDAKTTTVARLVTRNPVVCGPEDDLESCERLMQQHQIRRALVIDAQGRCIGIVAQADLALRLEDQPQRVQKTVAAISRRSVPRQPSAAA